MCVCGCLLNVHYCAYRDRSKQLHDDNKLTIDSAVHDSPWYNLAMPVEYLQSFKSVYRVKESANGNYSPR